MTDLISELAWRGLIHQSTDPDGLSGWLAEKPRTMYIGFDPTADSLHAGSLVQLMLLRRFQRAGHRPIALVGGATGMIGDPSGKSQERNLLSIDQLRNNIAGMGEQMKSFLDFDAADRSAVMVNNFDWMRRLSYLDFLRDIGKNFPVNVMMTKDSVKSRLGRSDGGLSYTEFSYMLLQAYDFVHLLDEFQCELQVGGSDQWGNITAGIDLARRMRSRQVYGLTCPLLTKSDGSKMGKTEEGTVWLSDRRTSPYAFYQYWITIADEDAGSCLRMLTELPKEEIEALDEARRNEPHRRASQRRLAEALTQLVHGDDGLQAAERATKVFFGAEIDQLSETELVEIFADVPSSAMAKDRLEGDGINIIDALVEAGLSRTKGEARRIIEQGGAYVNNRRVSDLKRQLAVNDLASETVMVLRAGKNRYALLRFE